MLKNFFIKNSVVPECEILGKAQPNLDFHSVTLWSSIGNGKIV